MSDEYNDNTNINEENVSEEVNETPVNETPEPEIKKEEAHTTIPTGAPNQNFYNGYQQQDGQYRIVYNRQQTNYNPYGGQNYGQGQNANPYSQGYNNGNNNPGYGYQYTQPQKQPYQQNYQQPYRQSQPAPAKEKKSGGKIAAVIAVAAALAIIFSVVSLVFGVMLGRKTVSAPTDTDSGTVTSPDTSDRGAVSAVTDEIPSSVTEPSPLTDPDATVNKDSSGNDLSRAEAAAKVVDSVVEIRTEQVVRGSFMQQYVSQGAGSGVVITEDGYIATNNHVIEGATTITVTLRDGTKYNATLVGTDATTDVAVVKIDASGLKAATFGDSDKLVVAQSVLAIGNPLGELGGSVTEGIISSLARNIVIENQAMTLLQTTAAINPGNSGGGLFNLAGECVGIVNAKSSGTDIEGIGFAIPSNTAIKVIEDLMHYGYVRGRVMLGITMVEINDQYSLYRYNLTEAGVYVNRITVGSDAEKAGIQQADRIVSINGTKIENSSQVKSIIQSCSVGDVVEIVLSRNGNEVTVRVTLSEYIPSSHAETSQIGS